MKNKRIALLLVVLTFVAWRLVHHASALAEGPHVKEDLVTVPPAALAVRIPRAGSAGPLRDQASPPLVVGGEVASSAAECQAACGVACEHGSCPPLCTRDSDCADGRVCAATAAATWRCLASDCASDDDCAGGTCVREAHLGAAVSRCAPAGDRAAGAVCGLDAGACKKGLMCSEGMCLPTTCAADTDCPRGAACVGMAGPEKHQQCIPACMSDADCSDGRTCHGVSAERSVCTAKFEAECMTKGCDEGAECQVLHRSPDAVVAECLKTCASDEACGTGGACVEISQSRGKVNYGCLPTCQDSDACAHGRACHWVPSLTLGLKVCSL